MLLKTVSWYKSHMLGHPLRRGWNLTKLLHCIVCASAPLIFLETKNALNHHTRIKEYTIRSGSQKRALSKINTMVVCQLFSCINQNWGGGPTFGRDFEAGVWSRILTQDFEAECWSIFWTEFLVKTLRLKFANWSLVEILIILWFLSNLWYDLKAVTLMKALIEVARCAFGNVLGIIFITKTSSPYS